MPDAPDAFAVPPARSTAARPRIAALIGFRGTGKTSVGVRLAALLRCECVDTDRLIEAAAGRSVRDVFEDEGEEGFRTRESAALQAAFCDAAPATGDQTIVRVVSIGGGAVLREENRSRLRATAFSIWLTAAPATIVARLQADIRTASLRPALTDKPLDEEVQTLLTEREPLYAALAAARIDTTDSGIDDVAQRVAAELAALLNGGGSA